LMGDDRVPRSEFDRVDSQVRPAQRTGA